MRNEQMSSDAAITRVLAGLASVEAPHGIEQRVLSAVQGRLPEQRTSLFTQLSAFTRVHVWVVAGGVAVLAVAASLAVRRQHKPQHDEAVLKQHTSSPTTTVFRTVIAESQSEPKLRQAMLAASRPDKDSASAEDINDLDALAVIEMNAPSKPAPLLPLTHQEELLAGAMHQDGPIDLSSLRPEMRAKQMELSKAEFHNFFEPPPTKDNE